MKHPLLAALLLNETSMFDALFMLIKLAGIALLLLVGFIYFTSRKRKK